jgi:hypothetical protein
MMAAVLTFEQKELVKGKLYANISYFNPIQDANDNWVIFEEEFNTKVEEFSWIKNCPKIEFIQKEIDFNLL